LRIAAPISFGGEITTRTVVIATGASYRRMSVPAEEALLRKGVYYGGATTEAPGICWSSAAHSSLSYEGTPYSVDVDALVCEACDDELIGERTAAFQPPTAPQTRTCAPR
jgi:hypothetical protein